MKYLKKRTRKPWWAPLMTQVAKNPPPNAGDLGWDDPRRRKWQPPRFLPESSERQEESGVPQSPWSYKELGDN